MGLLTDHDRAMLQAVLNAVVLDNMESVAMRRGSTTLPAQNVRIARQGMVHRRQDSGAIEQREQRVVVMGGPGLDIQPGDRFNDGSGNLYEVDFVRPNRIVATVAEARVIG